MQFTRHAHDTANELHGKVFVIHRFGGCQHKGAWRIEPGACRLLEDQHLNGGVDGDGSHHDRVGFFCRMHRYCIGGNRQLLGQKVIRFTNGRIAIGHLHQQQRNGAKPPAFEQPADVLVTPPGPAQHRQLEVGDALHRVAQVIHHGFQPGFVQSLGHHVSTAHTERLEGNIARAGNEFIELRVFGRGASHEQIVGPQPLHKTAKLGGHMQGNVRLVHDQANLQAPRARQGKVGRQTALAVI
ncbi:hypothetical protein GALL_500120 [mine drainage metagenome]|uniref:Uncharacterized protein n=1 Tax=mine drainage metagenome TaxID=410659 RepID=A0A1J5PLE6_9ZZZZ